MDYDTWFDYLRLLESEGDFNVTREAYEKAIAQLPPIQVRLVELVASSRFSRSAFLGEAILAPLYLSLDQLRSLRRAGS